eukprot:gene52946-40914_t
MRMMEESAEGAMDLQRRRGVGGGVGGPHLRASLSCVVDRTLLSEEALAALRDEAAARRKAEDQRRGRAHRHG